MRGAGRRGGGLTVAPSANAPSPRAAVCAGLVRGVGTVVEAGLAVGRLHGVAAAHLAPHLTASPLIIIIIIIIIIINIIITFHHYFC